MAAVAHKFEPIVVWEPQPGPQTALLTCPVFEIFYGGARGGGKTDAVLGEFASHADMYGIHAIGLIVRRERTQLTEMIERSKAIYLPIGASYNEQKKMWRFPNGARCTFAYLENDSDAEAYQGHSYTRVYVEEIGNFPRPEPILKLMATLRSAAGVPCGFRATGNPGGAGHLWIKQRYIDPAPLGHKILKSEFKNPFNGQVTYRDRVFIPARVVDNKYTNTAEYIAQLQMAGNAQLVEAWLHGRWDVIMGAFFQEWDQAKHVIRQFVVPRHWTRFVSMDWGSASPFSVGWWAVVPDTVDVAGQYLWGREDVDPRYAYRHDLPRGAMVRYREWYGSQNHNNVGLKLNADEVAKGIAQREAKEPTDQQGNSRIAYRVLDPSAFKTDGGPSIAERMWLTHQIRFKPADNARTAKKGAMGGWDQVRARLVGQDGQPMIYFMEHCVDSIRTIPALQHDTDNPEDVDTDGEDHAPDEVRYACMSRPYAHLGEAPKPDRIVAVGVQNELTIKDVMDDELVHPRRFRSNPRIR